MRSCQYPRDEYRMMSIIALIVLCTMMTGVLLAAGCVGNSIEKNSTAQQNGTNSPATAGSQVNFLSPYTAPIGGFDQRSAMLNPNTTFEINYTFYSQDWGPGEVNYSMSVWYMNGSYINRTYWCCPFPLNQTGIYIEPSSFIAEPNHSYSSRVSLNTSTLPREFFTGIYDSSGGSVHNPIRVNVTVRLGDNSPNYADDQISFQSQFGGPMTYDVLSSKNCSVQMKRGETKIFSFTFQHNVDEGIGEITFAPSFTPLNVTITPSHFIAKPSVEFPFTVAVSANQTVAPGNYPFIITVNGVTSPDMIHCLDSDTYLSPQNTQTQSFFPVNVTVV